MDELKAKQKKELKKFDTDQRVALKQVKANSGKGKKGKEALAKAEAEWNVKNQTLNENHSQQLSDLQGGDGNGDGDADTNVDGATANTSTENANANANAIEETNTPEPAPELSAKEKALAKKIRKRQKKLAKEKAREEQIAYEMANAPNPRQMEIDAIMELYLAKDNFMIEEVAADGNCLYRAIARQMKHLNGDVRDYTDMREICSNEFLDRREEYEPFADLAEMKVTSFEEYASKVRKSSEWGGHLELKALAYSLKKTIVVYSTESALEIKGDGEGSGDDADDDRIRLSFHRKYYALGEHYNSVIEKEQAQ